MKKRYVLAALAAMTVLAGCGDNASQQKNTDNTTQESTAEDDLTAADPDEDGEELDPEFSQDVENNEVIDADDAEEEAALDPITPSEYLVQNASDYVTLGDYDGVEVTRYTYEITDDMVQDEIQEELADASDEQSTNAPSEDGNIVYMNLTATVEGEEAAEPEETFITLGQEEFGAEFDQKLTGVSTGDKLDFSITYGDDTWQEDWQGKTVDFSVEITDVTASNTPEYDEDYVKNYTGYDTKEEYEASVKEYLEQSYEEQSTYDETEDLISACLARTEFTGEYPDDLFEACREEALSGYSMFVEEDGDVNDVLDMFGALPEEVAVLRYSSAHVMNLQQKAKVPRKTMKAMDKADRENTIVDMYVNGHSFEDIMAVSGYNSRSSVFSVLNRHGVKLNRGKFKGPLGKRKPKDGQ